MLVLDQEGVPVPKVIDFGVAKTLSQRLTEKTLYTQVGTFIGTPESSSLEQAEQSLETPNRPRSCHTPDRSSPKSPG